MKVKVAAFSQYFHHGHHSGIVVWNSYPHSIVNVSFRSKLGHGLVSGNYSTPPKNEGTDEEKAAEEVVQCHPF